MTRILTDLRHWRRDGRSTPSTKFRHLQAYELAVEELVNRRLAVAFDELALAI
jgi:hypothetical protein